MAYCFGDFTLDPEARQLLRADEEVHLAPKTFDLLTLLVSRRARAVPKAELLQELWPGTFVEETNLAGLVADLRRALGDSAEKPRFVRTIFGFGYRFVGEVTEAAVAAPVERMRQRCWLILPGREVPLLEGANIIGRAADAAIQIDSPGLSRHHARIVVSGTQAIVEDLGSKNGTHLNGRRITGPSPLVNGDEILFGALQATFRVAGHASPTATLTSGAT